MGACASAKAKREYVNQEAAADRRREREARERELEAARKREAEEAAAKRRRESEAREIEAERKREEDKALAAQTELILSHQSIELTLSLLPRMVNLTKLELQHCGLDDLMAIKLATAMINCKFITTFDIQYNRIGARGFKALISVTCRLKIWLYFIQGLEGKVGNQIGCNNVLELLTLPSPINPNLSEKDAVNHVKIGTQIYLKVGVLCLWSMCLSEQNLGDEGATIVAEHFENLVQLRTLFFYRNGVGEKGANSFAKFLPKIPSLENLDLSGNNIPKACYEKLERVNQFREVKLAKKVKINLENQSSVYLPQYDEDEHEILYSCELREERQPIVSVLRDQAVREIAEYVLSLEARY